jgi:hypothetical protein
MTVSFNERLIAYLTLLSGLSISAVAVYYSVVGLTAIFSAAFIPIIIMGTVLEIGKLVATVWLKQNWSIAPRSVRAYLMTAILVLMLITSMGIFGFLSKAHSDQSLVSGDVLSQLALYDEKIKTAKENIQEKRKELKQMDEAVDQVMARSQDEKGADKSIALRKSQQRDRARISKEIEAEQTRLSELNNQAVPIRAQVRAVEAEVGPLKYIAAFVYGETDQTVLEKAVTWVIITLIVVFDPLAVILLLASQISFQNFREQLAEESQKPDPWIADVGEKPTVEEKAEDGTSSTYTGFIAQEVAAVLPEAVVTEPPLTSVTPEQMAALFPELVQPANHHPDTHPYLRQGFKYPDGWEHQPPLVYKEETPAEEVQSVEPPKVKTLSSGDYVEIDGQKYNKRSLPPGYIQNEEQAESGKWKEIAKAVQTQITEEEYVKRAQERQNEKNNPDNPA